MHLMARLHLKTPYTALPQAFTHKFLFKRSYTLVQDTQKPTIFDILAHQSNEIRKTFQFSVGVSAKPKGSDLALIPVAKPPLRSIQVGEDAFFTRHDAMGVADGVGGWAGVQGANAAHYSLMIMHHAGVELEKYDDFVDDDDDGDDYDSVLPGQIIKKSYEKVNAAVQKEQIVGSTTALVALLRVFNVIQDDELRIGNIGDCGIMVIRDGECVFRNEEQQHSFNFPFQLGTGSRNTPDDAQSFIVKVQEGDIVLMGSDGLFDNVFDEEIVEIVNANTHAQRATSTSPQAISDALLKKAREVAEDNRSITSPFQERAVQEGFYYQGGKIDDMTILVGIIWCME